MMNLLRAFRPLAGDFLSTIFFIVFVEITGDVVIATSVGIATGIVQFLWLKSRRHKIELMQYASLALVIVLGTATLLTRDPRFVMFKPSIAGFAIAVVMLKRGWQLRYLPAIVKENAGERFLTVWGYLWSALYFALAAGNLYVVQFHGLQDWVRFNAIAPTVGPLALFLIQYAAIRVAVGRAMRARMAAGTMTAPAE